MIRPILILLFVFGTCVLCQAQTTQEEYNYLTKYLRRVVEEGADAKVGYSLGAPIVYRHDKYFEVTFAPFIKSSTNQMVAISAVIKQTPAFGSVTFTYFCIPVSNASLLAAYLSEVEKLYDSTELIYARYIHFLMVDALLDPARGLKPTISSDTTR